MIASPQNSSDGTNENLLQDAQEKAVKALFVEHDARFAIESGTIAMTFSLNETAGRQTLFSKDASGNGDGGHIVVFAEYGRLNIRIQDKAGETWIKTDQILSADQEHNLELKFGENGFEVLVDGKVEAQSDFAFSLANNEEALKLGANGWASTETNPYSAQSFMEGTISGFTVASDSGEIAYELDTPLVLDGAGDIEIIQGGTLPSPPPTTPTPGPTPEPETVKALFLEHFDALEVDTGSIAMTFSLDSISGRQTLFSKDASGNGDGGHIVVFVEYGRLNIRIQDKTGEAWVKTGPEITAGTVHQLELHFGNDGFDVLVDGVEKAHSDFVFSLSNNEEILKLGTNGWASRSNNPHAAQDFMEGTISDFKIVSADGDAKYELNTPLVLDGAAAVKTVTDGTAPPEPPVTPNPTPSPEAVKALFQGHKEALEIDSGSIAMTFSLESTTGRQTLFSKDASGNGDGGHIVVFAENGRLSIRIQDDVGEAWVTTGVVLAAHTDHKLDLQFGSNGFDVLVDGVLTAHSDFDFSLANNKEVLKLGANGWASSSNDPNAAQDFMEGTISSFSITSSDGQEKYALDTPLKLDSTSNIEVLPGDDTPTTPPTSTPPPHPTPVEPSEQVYDGALNNFILTDFNGDGLAHNGAGDTYPSLYQGVGTGTVELVQDDAVLGNALKVSIDAGGAMQLQFNPYEANGNRGYAREQAEDDTQIWQFDTYNRMKLWIKKPVSDELQGVRDNGQSGNDTHIGTYVKNTELDHQRSDEAGGGHYYHHVMMPDNGEWTQVIINMHPNHQRGAGQNGNYEWGNQEHVTGEDNINYFDALTRFYIDNRADKSDKIFTEPVEFYIDEIEFYQSQYVENDEQVYSLASNYDGETLSITWNRNKNENSVQHEVRYAFENIHETGWDNAIQAPEGMIAPQGSLGYNGMSYITDDLPLAGKSVLYVAIKPENSDLFTQIEVPLDPDGDGNVNYADFVASHRDGSIFDVEAPPEQAVTGSAENDVLVGTSGDDTLNGFTGDDTLTGGSGQDTFVFAIEDASSGSWGHDVITDYQSGTDALLFDIADGNSALLKQMDTEDGALISYGEASSILVQGVTLNDLTTSFIFE